jgi:hypothetical protein
MLIHSSILVSRALRVSATQEFTRTRARLARIEDVAGRG